MHKTMWNMLLAWEMSPHSSNQVLHMAEETYWWGAENKKEKEEEEEVGVGVFSHSMPWGYPLLSSPLCLLLQPPSSLSVFLCCLLLLSPLLVSKSVLLRHLTPRSSISISQTTCTLKGRKKKTQPKRMVAQEGSGWGGGQESENYDRHSPHPCS